jgi:hypothetical protein
MSTFMAFGCVDLRAGSDIEEFIAALGGAVRAADDVGDPLTINLGERDGRPRLSLYANHGSTWLGPVVLRAAAATGTVERVVLGLDHDEYGIEHLVLVGTGPGLARAQHFYVSPDGVPDPANGYGPTLTDIPVRDGLEAAPDGTVGGAPSWAVVAALYDIPPERVVPVAGYERSAHEQMGVVFAPFAPWWDAIGVVYPGELGPPDRTVAADG